MSILKPLPVLAAAVFLFATAGHARGDVVRFHYNPAVAGSTSLKALPEGGGGEWRPWRYSLLRGNYRCPPKATHMVTFRHPFTSQTITLPITFPDGTPRIAYGSSTITYYYTGYSIRVEFQPNGSADVVYNSGLLRPAFLSD